MTLSRITFKEFASVKNLDSFPTWLKELVENHKSTWEPNSKGGEPNFLKEPSK